MEPSEPKKSISQPAASPEKKRNGVWDTVRFVIISLVIVLGFRYFVAQPFIVSGDSMIPTFRNGEYLIVDELSYHFVKPSRGDIIIMRYPLDTAEFFIKRIIGLPGETLHFSGNTITVTETDGKQVTLKEPYLGSDGNNDMTVTLDKNQYYVLGDNRAESSDSRRWGPLPAQDIVGRPVIRLLPLSRLSWMPGAENPAAPSTP